MVENGVLPASALRLRALRLSLSLVAVVVASGWPAHLRVESAPPSSVEVADQLFRDGHWVEARGAYDAAAKGLDHDSAEFREAIGRTVEASLRLKDLTGALERATAVFPARKDDDERVRLPQDDPSSIERWKKKLAQLEFSRELLVQIESSSEADEDFASRLSAARIELNQRMVRHLNPPHEERTGWGGASLASIDWWWDGVPQADEYFNNDERYSRWHWHKSVSVGRDGQPIFVDSPPAYTAGLARSQKLLFILAEIENLDTSAKRNDAARALLARARVMRRLYGPQTDVDWWSAEFYYRYDKRPSFVPSRSAAGAKETWELADDEARTNIGEQSHVITLPEEHSPLALLRRLERDYPESDTVVDALHEQGLYYQSRRQFAKALEAYRLVIERFPGNPLAKKAKAQIERIEHADVLLGRTGIYASGLEPTLWFACRNADKVEFTAWPFDLDAWMKESKKESLVWLRRGGSIFRRFFGDDTEQSAKLKAFVGGESARWTEPVNRSDRIQTNSTMAPLTESGVYFVEAQVPGSDQKSGGLVVVSGIAVIQKAFSDKLLLWVVDPRTGRPISNQELSVAEGPWSNGGEWRETTLTSNELGVAEYRYSDEEHTHGFVIAMAQGRGTTFCELADRAYDFRQQHDVQLLALTDRPLYRPGSKVNFRIWVRDLVDRTYLPAKAGLKLQIEVRAPQYQTIRAMTLETDESGSVSGSFDIGAEAPLGEYALLARVPGEEHDQGAGSFRVEEYKAPEFEVTVAPAKNIARPGEPISARVEARYYFGAPVANGEVRYSIFRRERRHAYALPAQYDWLYGRGYGAHSSGRQRDDGDDFGDSSLRFSFGRSLPRGERVEEGRASLDASGRVEIRFDPIGALGVARERDWEYTIEVQVRDEGQRTVEGTGSVLAPRQEFHALVELERGWYAVDDTVVVDINTRSANDVPVTCAGEVLLHRLEDSDQGAPPGIEPIQEWQVALDADGRHNLRFAVPQPGRYRLEFRTRDSWDREVSAMVEFWVYDAAADYSRCLPPALKVIPDQRTYQVGQTARLLFVTATSDAQVLICDSFGDHRFLSIRNQVKVLEIPIEAQHVPNLLIEATAVREGKVYTETCQLFVPPVHDLLTVQVAADKPIYKPGEKAKIKLKVTDHEGRPVRGDLALTAFDKAVTYIEPESGMGPKAFIENRKTTWYWTRGVLATLDPRCFDTSGNFMCPEYYLIDEYVPQIGIMAGAPPTGGDPGDAAASKTNARDEFEPEELPNGTPAVADVRTDFSETALWEPHLKLDEAGLAETEINFPQSLTTWRIRGYLVTNETRVGDLAHEVVTTKNLLVRLQRPRFLVESDEVVLSANVHNKLASDKSVTAELLVPAAVFRPARPEAVVAPDREGNLLLTAKAVVPASEQHRFDWTLSVVGEGLATVTIKALTDEESDAMRTAIPVREHGSPVSVTQNGSVRGDEAGDTSLVLDVPNDVDPRKTRVSVSLASTPATAAFEAIPFLAGYPYGCVEQSMSRFYPTVLAARTLKQLDIDIAQLVQRSRQRRQSPSFGPSPEEFLDAGELGRMTEAGLQRLYRFQHDDGGWGWWEHDQSSPYMTAYVLMGLHAAAESGAEVNNYVFDRGLSYLAKPDARRQPTARRVDHAGNDHTAMFVAYVLALPRPSSFESREGHEQNEIKTVGAKQLDAMFQRRELMTHYDRSLLALALHHRERNDQAVAVVREMLEAIESDDERDIAHLPVGARDWWRSWNSDVETNAWLLRALVAIDRENSVVPRLVNWLALNRKHGRFWRSTKDTALAVTALSEYLAASGADGVDQAVEVRIDDGPPSTVRVGGRDILGIETVLVAGGRNLSPGHHVVSLHKMGTGPMHFALHADFLRKVERGEAHAKGIAITRRYFSSDSAAGKTALEADAVTEGSRRLAIDDTVAVGDQIEVELKITADEDYDYVAFEDVKPAGCEPVQLRSGYTWGNDLWANIELRDDRVVFFASYLHKGEHVLRYKLRAERPGHFHVLPARGFAMYAPEVNGQSDEFRVRVTD